MEEIKTEKFGSRISLLKPILESNNIEFITNLWVVTCRQAVNNDKNSRYLVIIENVFDLKYNQLLDKINRNIPIINVIFDETEKKIKVYNFKTDKHVILNYKDFKESIIRLTKCRYIDSFALGSKESTALSRFFREHMGKGFALTDIDFYLTKKKLFLEEKNFVRNNTGYIGVGQCISFKEIILDVFPDIELSVVCISDNNYFTCDFKSIDCSKSEIISGWGKMVPFKVNKITLTNLLDLFN